MSHPPITDIDYLPLPGSEAASSCQDCVLVQLIFDDCLCLGCAIALLDDRLDVVENDSQEPDSASGKALSNTGLLSHF